MNTQIILNSREIDLLQSVLNEVCNGIYIENFEVKLHGKLHELEKLLRRVTQATDLRLCDNQFCGLVVASKHRNERISAIADLRECKMLVAAIDEALYQLGPDDLDELETRTGAIESEFLHLRQKIEGLVELLC